MTDEELIAEARRARERARASYSTFAVGAAVLDVEGGVHPGCNVENASYGLTICAERVALVGMVARGAPAPQVIAVVADTVGPVRPCGACRQVMAELAPGARVVMANLSDARDVGTVEDLLPRSFRFEDAR